MLTKPIFKAMALLVALSLSLPNPALALRTREAGELPETLSGLEEALQTGPDAVLHEIGRTVRSLLPKSLTPSIPTAGLEEPQDLTERILGPHPFPVQVFSGAGEGRFQLFLYEPDSRNFSTLEGFRAVPLGAQHQMIGDRVSESLLLRTLSSGLPFPLGSLLPLVSTLTNEEFNGRIERMARAWYDRSPDRAVETVRQLSEKPTATLLRWAKKPDQPSRDLILLALLYKLREYFQEAYGVHHIESVQIAMDFLRSNGDYRALIENVKRVLKNPRGNPRRPAQPDVEEIIISDIESVDLSFMKEGNTTTVYQVSVKLKGRTVPVLFALNVAKDATAATAAMRSAWSTLTFYYETDPHHVMEPYLYSEVELPLGEGNRAARKSVGVLTGEWIDGDEIHFYVSSSGQPDMRIWKPHAPGVSLPAPQADQVWAEMVRMQARYSALLWGDAGSIPMVQPAFIALNAGDLVWHQKPDGSFVSLLIWPWAGPYDLPIEASEFLVRSLLASAVDQETSASSRQGFWGQPERALQIVQEELSLKLQDAARLYRKRNKEVFARTWWKKIARDAAERVIPEYLENPDRFLQSWFFNETERQHAIAQLQAAQTTLRNHLAAGLEEPKERKTVSFNENLSADQLETELAKYFPWGFNFYDGSAFRGGKAGFSPGKRGWPLRLLIGFMEKAGISIDNSWQKQGWKSLHAFITESERPQFDLTILLNADPTVPPGRTFAIIVGHSAGLEERNLDRIFPQLADSIQGPGVVVLDQETTSRTGLEEMVRRAPPELLKRMVFLVGAARAAEFRKLNSAVQVIPDNDVGQLAALLISLPQADQVTVLSETLLLAQQLRRLLPATMAVTQLDPTAAFRLILAALGVPNSVLNQVDATGLEESFARARAA